MRRCSGTLVAVAVTVALAGACSVEDGPVGQRSPQIAITTATAVDDTAPTTVPPPLSSAVIEIGPARYELDAVCADVGAGEMEVAVEGVDVNGLRVVGLIRAFLGAPYIGLQIGESSDAKLFEPRLEGTLPFDLVDDVLTFPEVDFVTELDLSTGEFVPAGIGSVVVECNHYAQELPEVLFG